MAQLPVCQHCHTQWTYWQALKNSFFLRCPYCNKRNYAKKFRRRDFMYSLIAAVIILFILPSLDMDRIWTFAWATVAVVIYMAVYPFNLEMTIEDPFSRK